VGNGRWTVSRGQAKSVWFLGTWRRGVRVNVTFISPDGCT